jgi:hypothetical protein
VPGWDNFYYLIGSASAGLIGLLFVVITLNANAGRDRESALRGASLYMTPTVVNFGVVLSVSAISLAPALPMWAKGAAFAVAAAFGLGYALRACFGVAVHHARRALPHWSDVWFYAIAPAVIHLALAGVIIGVFWAPPRWLPYALAGLLLVLLLLGVRNAWDLVTWIASGSGAAQAAQGNGERSA